MNSFDRRCHSLFIKLHLYKELYLFRALWKAKPYFREKCSPLSSTNRNWQGFVMSSSSKPSLHLVHETNLNCVPKSNVGLSECHWVYPRDISMPEYHWGIHIIRMWPAAPTCVSIPSLLTCKDFVAFIITVQCYVVCYNFWLFQLLFAACASNSAHCFWK
jgi:hypothetical protein